MAEHYIPAEAAWHKLQLAYGLHTSVYMYGCTGYGKTTMAQQFLAGKDVLWLNGHDEAAALTEQMQSIEKYTCVVVDDLHVLTDQEAQDAVMRLVDSGRAWVLLIGRTEPPGWLLPLLSGMRIVVITENDLHIGPAELDAIFKAHGIALSPKEQEEFCQRTEGNVLAIGFILQKLRNGKLLNSSIFEQILVMFSEYLERYVINQWDNQLLDFLMQVSVVDHFSLALAEAITGDDQTAMMLRHAMCTGNFIGQEDGEYRIRNGLLEPLRIRALKEMGRQRVNQCRDHAARFYELHDDLPAALALYEASDNQESIRALLVRNARRNPGSGWYFEMRRYYMALDDAVICKSPVLMAAMSMLYSILMDSERSEMWYQRLRDYAAEAQGGDKREAQSQLVYLDIGLPHRGSANLISIMKAVPSVLRRSEFTLPAFSLTNNQPSLMNGSKDFCDWSKTDRLLADTIGLLVERLMGKGGVGLVDMALGESAYEKGEDHYTVLSHLTSSQSDSESRGELEMTFASVGVQARMSVTRGNLTHALKLLDGIEQRARKEHAHRILLNIDALRCRVHMINNDMESVRRWMEQAPDETQEFCTLERYRYMTKVRAYLASGCNLEALSLAERMIAYANKASRTYILIECDMFSAMARKRLGMDWKPAMLSALRRASAYQFVRVLSEEGAALLPLLKMVRSQYLAENGADKAWFERVVAETERMNRWYPSYQSENKADLSDFSDMALAVLRMQADGLSTKEIADELKISQRTVKYHASENYAKLGAKGVVDAVQIARSMHLL